MPEPDLEVVIAMSNIPPLEDVEMQEVEPALAAAMFQPELEQFGYDPNFAQSVGNTGPGSTSPTRGHPTRGQPPKLTFTGEGPRSRLTGFVREHRPCHHKEEEVSTGPLRCPVSTIQRFLKPEDSKK